MQAFLLWVIKSKLSKPIDKDEFLRLHSDNTHKLIAGVAVVDDEGPHPKLVHLLLAFLVLICFLDSCD